MTALRQLQRVRRNADEGATRRLPVPVNWAGTPMRAPPVDFPVAVSTHIWAYALLVKPEVRMLCGGNTTDSLLFLQMLFDICYTKFFSVSPGKLRNSFLKV
jgi:hypothetical protein